MGFKVDRCVDILEKLLKSLIYEVIFFGPVDLENSNWLLIIHEAIKDLREIGLRTEIQNIMKPLQSEELSSLIDGGQNKDESELPEYDLIISGEIQDKDKELRLSLILDKLSNNLEKERDIN